MALPFIPMPDGSPPSGWSYLPFFGWLFTTIPLSQADLDEKTRVQIEQLRWEFLWQAYEVDLILVGSEAWATQQLEYEVAVICDSIGWVEFNWWDNVKWFIDDLATKFEKFLKAIHFKTILAVHQVAMLVSPQYRAMMQRIFRSMSELSKAIGMGPAFIDLAVRSTRQLVMDASAAVGKTYDLGQVAWLAELGTITKMIAANAKRYATEPFLLFTDLEEDIERRFGNESGETALGALASIKHLLTAVGSIAGGIEKINADALKLLNDLPTFIKAHIDPRVFDIMNRIDNVINIDINPKIANLHSIIAPFGADIQAAMKEAKDAAARILSPKKIVLALPALPDIEQDEVLAGLNALDNRRMSDMLLKVAQWSRPVSDEFERLLQLPAPAKAPPVFLTLEHSLAPVPDLRAPVSGSGPFVGDY